MRTSTCPSCGSCVSTSRTDPRSPNPSSANARIPIPPIRSGPPGATSGGTIAVPAFIPHQLMCRCTVPKMAAVLGVEGGGSHTHAVVADDTGRLLGLGANRDTSNWEDGGIEAAGAAIKSCVRAAFASPGTPSEAIAGSVFALAGVDFPIDEMRLSGIPEALGLDGRTWLVNHSFASLPAGTDRTFGVVISARTAAILAGR